MPLPRQLRPKSLLNPEQLTPLRVGGIRRGKTVRRRLVTGLSFEAMFVDPVNVWEVLKIDVESEGIVNLRH